MYVPPLSSGTLLQLSKATHPFLWKAFQVSVGRLGIITAVTVRYHVACFRVASDISVLSLHRLPSSRLCRIA